MERNDCPLLDKPSSTEFELCHYEESKITGNPLYDLAVVGTGLRKVNTPEEEYPSFAYSGMKKVRNYYASKGLPISDEVWNTAIKFYGLTEMEEADKASSQNNG